ncbi:hypothetical protein ABW20_dc0110053 [Dactylellina cionopaga]|nr:hypothetical protein ABW20_dc0110053 [Dactylellina cionopaga]
MAFRRPLNTACRIAAHHPTTATLLPTTRPQCFLLLFQAQSRSVSDYSRAQKSINQMFERMGNKESVVPSMRTQKAGAMMEEIAELLLPSTFICPPLSRRPSILFDTRNRIKFEWVRKKIKTQDFVSRFLARLWYGDPFFRKDIIPSAEALHRNMYTAFARGDLETLSQICGRDLYHTFRSRIISRPPNVQFSWKFSEYNSSSKIFSHKIGMMGEGKVDENSIRQAVVRIDSTQTLTKGINGKVVKGTGEPVRTTEFVVLHKRRKRDVPETPWVIWGTVQESGMDIIHAHGNAPTAADEPTAAGSNSRWKSSETTL